MTNPDQFAYDMNLQLEMRGSTVPRVSPQQVEETYWPEMEVDRPVEAAEAHVELTYIANMPKPAWLTQDDPQ